MTYKLLVADDSVTIQRVIELTFADEDVKVSTVGDGQAAIDRLESDPPDIVLADIDMPKRDGYEVAAYVRSRPKLAHIPVVLLTGAFEPIDQARADAAGSSDVLAKPFEPQMVINRVKQLLGKKRAEMEVPAAASVAPPAPQHPPTTEAPEGLKAPSAPRPPARSSMAMNDEHATQQDQPARPAPGEAAGQPPVSLDDYFDQLDAAFSSLPQPGSKAAQHDTMHAEEEWLDSQVLDQQAAPHQPLITPPPASRPPAPPAPLPQPTVATLVAPPPAIARPEPAPMPPVEAAPPAPTPEAVTRPAAPVITDEVIEEVVARVLARLSDRVVRETVTNIVSTTAERLVQEEIARIKSEGQ